MRNRFVKGIVSAILITSVAWILGLWLSTVKTKRIVKEFYQWVHQESSFETDFFPDTITLTAPELKRRFDEYQGPFKRHTQLGIDRIPGLKLPRRPHYTLGLGSATNGSGYYEGLNYCSSFYTAHLRTEMEPGDDTYGVVVVFVRTSLFGF